MGGKSLHLAAGPLPPRKLIHTHRYWTCSPTAQNWFTLFFVCLLSLVLESQVAHSPGWPGIWDVAEDNLGLRIFLPPSPKCWDDKHAPIHVVYAILKTKAKAHSWELHLQP